MIPWTWLIPAVSGGGVLGFFLCACLAVGARDEELNRAFYAGLKEGREDFMSADEQLRFCLASAKMKEAKKMLERIKDERYDADPIPPSDADPGL